MSQGAEAVPKDLEGISDAEASPASNQQDGKKPSGKPRQKKIAVLTSGGDSAGMNAAGEYTFLSFGQG